MQTEIPKRTRRSSFLVAATVSVVSMQAPPAVAQSDEQRAAARSLAFDGAKACSEQRFQDCVDLFQRAESLVHAPPHLLYAARAHERLGHLVKARELYVKMTRERLSAGAPQAFHDAQAAAADALSKIEPRIAYLTVKLKDDAGKTVEVTLDGEAVPAALLGVPRPVDPGEHQVEGKGPGLHAAVQKTTLAEGARGAVTLTFEPTKAGAVAETTKELPKKHEPSTAGSSPDVAPPPSGEKTLRLASYGALGLGVAGLAVGTIFGLKSKANRADADQLDREQCSAGCDKDSATARKIASLDDGGRSAKTLSLVGFAVGGAGVAAGTVLFFLSRKGGHEEPKTGVTVRPWVGIGTAGLDGRF